MKGKTPKTAGKDEGGWKPASAGAIK